MANSYVSKDKLIMNGIVAMAMRFVGLAISFFLIPIFIRKMGAELYGIWLLPNIALGQIGFVDLGFTAGVSRNIAVCYAQRNYEELSQSIWTGIFILAVIGLLGGVFFIFGQGQIAHWFHIKETDMQMASSLFRLVGIGLIIQWPLKILGTILHVERFLPY